MPCTGRASSRRRSAPSRSAARGSRPRSRAAATRPPGGRRFSRYRRLQLRDLDMVHAGERQLEEALAEPAELRGVPRRDEAVGAVAPAVVLDSLSAERLGDLARRLLGREDEGHVAPEDAFENRTDQRVMSAA